MIPPHKRKIGYTFAGESYTLSLATDRPFVYLDARAGTPLAELFVLSSIHPLRDRDDTVAVQPWEVHEQGEEATLTLRAQSSVWEEKIFRFRCQPHRFTYEVEVVGEGRLAEAHLFGGYTSAFRRWGSGFFYAGQSFRQGFTPEPNCDESIYFAPAESVTIDLTGVPLPGRGDWFFTPPPFCLGFRVTDGWLGMGIEATPGTNRFTEFGYTGRRDGFHLTLAYEGQTTVSGRYPLPAVGFDFGSDEYEVLGAHVRHLREAGYVPTPSDAPNPAWWREPIFCGWGAQCHLASLEQGHAPDYARQLRYERFLETLDQNKVAPGIVVLDDKWQATYGENRVDEQKWPDLRGFVDQQHAAGRRVLLWLKAWDPEGVPAEECITNAAGLPIAVDPTNPAYERRLRAAVRRMVSAAGYDADGFKIDFTARIPSGPGLQQHGDAWGLELMRCYLGLLHDEAKRHKPDALIMTHTPHPYLADVLDMVRLNDMNKEQDIPRAMRHRARVAALACPKALIDTDNWPITDRATWREYLPLQVELGVPSLYYASHVDETGESLEEADYRLLRATWTAYRSRQK